MRLCFVLLLLLLLLLLIQIPGSALVMTPINQRYYR